MNENERHLRNLISEVLVKHEFISEGKVSIQTVRNINKDGFDISGHFGGKFNKDDGLIIWNKSTRNVGKKMTISQLEELEQDLSKVFEQWKLK